MTDTKMLQEIAQEMAEMQKAMEQSGDTETRWTTPEIARQDLQDSWAGDAEAAGLDPEDTETRDQLWDMVVEAYFGPHPDPDMDPVAAVVAHIRRHMAGLVRKDADAVANGWNPNEYPESGYVWQEAERQLLAASGDEELDDGTYADLVDAIADILPDPEDMDEEKGEETMTNPTTETLNWTAKVLAANLERMADDAIENDLTEDEEQTLRDVAGRLQTGTATDADWREAIQQVDLYGCACWID